MEDERERKIVTLACELAAVAVVVLLLAGQYRTTLATQPQLPATGSSAQPLGFFERQRLSREIRSRYTALAELEGLTTEQQAELATIAELLGL